MACYFGKPVVVAGQGGLDADAMPTEQPSMGEAETLLTLMGALPVAGLRGTSVGDLQPPAGGLQRPRSLPCLVTSPGPAATWRCMLSRLCCRLPACHHLGRQPPVQQGPVRLGALHRRLLLHEQPRGEAPAGVGETPIWLCCGQRLAPACHVLPLLGLPLLALGAACTAVQMPQGSGRSPSSQRLPSTTLLPRWLLRLTLLAP